MGWEVLSEVLIILCNRLVSTWYRGESDVSTSFTFNSSQPYIPHFETPMCAQVFVADTAHISQTMAGWGVLCTMPYCCLAVNSLQCLVQVQAAYILDIPVVATEQYPKGLGNTVGEIDVSKASVFPKTKFSMVIPEVEQLLSEHQDRKSVVIMGIEVGR